MVCCRRPFWRALIAGNLVLAFNLLPTYGSLADRDGRLAYRRGADHRRGGDGGFIPCLFMDDGGIGGTLLALGWRDAGLVRLTLFAAI